jgi:alpha-mannosidase
MANQMTMSLRRFSELVILFVVLRPLCAQQAAPLPLSEKAQQILSRLNSFNSIDLGEWRYHLGDISNGEDPTLDDSLWQKIGPQTGLPTEAIWFRHEIVVPKQLNGYDLTNARVEFHIAVGAGGPSPLIIYMDGRQVALGADLVPIVLWEKAKPGDHVLIAAKALATDVAKNFRGASITITTGAARPSPGDFYKEAVSDSWILATVANGATQASVLEDAVKSVDMTALDRNDHQAFDASLRTAQQKLESLRPVVQSADIRMAGNSHMDAA